MDLLFLVLLLAFAGFFLLAGSWRGVALVALVGVFFLALSAFFILDTGVEVVNGTTTVWTDYYAFSNETVDGVNTTIGGSRTIANTYARLSREWEMGLVTILLAVSIYLMYGAWVGLNAKSDMSY